MWFVGELEVEKERLMKQRVEKERVEGGEEEETTGRRMQSQTQTQTQTQTQSREGKDGVVREMEAKAKAGGIDAAGDDEGMRLRVRPDDSTARRRTSVSVGDVSGTDSEWDKVEFEVGS